MAHSSERISPRSYLSRSFSYIKCKNLAFLICDAPTSSTLPRFIKEFERLHVTDIVRACEPTYSAEALQDVGIRVHDLSFPDGSVPNPQLIENFLSIVSDRFDNLGSPSSQSSDDMSPTSTIAVHCIAGLGRAPLLVAIALITYGMLPLDAVEYIRSFRRGAFNNRQIQFIDEYKRQKKSSFGISGASLRQSFSRIFKKKMELAAS